MLGPVPSTLCLLSHWSFLFLWLKNVESPQLYSFSHTPHLVCQKILSPLPSKCTQLYAHFSFPSILFPIISHSNYGNHLLTSLPPSTLSLPQFILNTAATVILWKPKSHYVTTLLKTLLWLPISLPLRIKPKVLTVAYKAYMIYQTALCVVSFLLLAFALAVLSPWNAFFRESAWLFPSHSLDLCSNTI